MLDAHVPANLHYFLVNYLSLVRLNSKQIDDSVEAWQKERGLENYKLIDGDDTAYTGLLNLCGYKHAFSRNLILAITIAMALLMILAFIFLWRCIKTRWQKTPKGANHQSYLGAWSLNFSLRFTYEFLMEICICVAINLAAYKVNANESNLLWGLTLLLGIFVLALICFVTSLFYRGGPYTVPTSYQKRSLGDSFWGKRALCLENCAKVCDKEDQKHAAVICQSTPRPGVLSSTQSTPDSLEE